MEQPLIICSTEVDSYEKHIELINAGYQLQKCENAADFYVHNDMPDLRKMKLGKKISSSYCEPEPEKYVVPTSYIFHLNNFIASFKAIKLLSTFTHSILKTRTTLYELARMIAPKNHNIAIHRSIDDDHQNDGVAMPLTSSQMESSK